MGGVWGEGVYYYTEYIIICSECVCGDHILIPTPTPHTHPHTHTHTHTLTHTHTHPRRCCPPSCIHSYTHHSPRAPLQSSSADKRYDTLCMCVCVSHNSWIRSKCIVHENRITDAVTDVNIGILKGYRKIVKIHNSIKL